MIKIRTATVSDIPLIQEMAAQVFPATYKDIITPGQCDYMMDMMYSSASLHRQYCSCMDFRTSQLGTCKHLEAVKRWIHRGRHVHREIPSYTSVYLDYTEGRKVRIRIGSDHEKEFQW